MFANSYPSLTAVLHNAVKMAKAEGSGLDARTIADTVGKPYATLMSELSRQEGHKLGADLVLPLIEAAGMDMVIKFLARQLGGVFVKVPEPAPCAACLVLSLAESIKEFGQFAAETAADISDGDITADQLGRIKKEGCEAIESIAAMIKLAEVTHEKQYGGRK